MIDKGEPYLSYLLRMWVVKNQGGMVWRFSVENVHTAERKGFDSLESLCDFLCQETAPVPGVELENDDFVV
ncbi:MAG: hypothetical protein ACK2U5_17755 [Candidatus Promineifilaceae bacterium]|jgi:hypothetical protein